MKVIFGSWDAEPQPLLPIREPSDKYADLAELDEYLLGSIIADEAKEVGAANDVYTSVEKDTIEHHSPIMKLDRCRTYPSLVAKGSRSDFDSWSGHRPRPEFSFKCRNQVRRANSKPKPQPGRRICRRT
jgi:hypothetical protein